MDNLAPAIVRRFLAADPAVGFEAVQQTGERRLLDAHSFGQLLLGELRSTVRKVNQRPPFALAEAEWPKTLIELGAPGAGGTEKHEAELILM